MNPNSSARPTNYAVILAGISALILVLFPFLAQFVRLDVLFQIVIIFVGFFFGFAAIAAAIATKASRRTWHIIGLTASAVIAFYAYIFAGIFR